MRTKKRVLILGSNGQLGSEINILSERFSKYDFVFSDKDELDISDFKKLEIFCTSIRPDYIINCSAYTAVDQAEKEQDNCYLINSECVKNIGLMAVKQNISLIHISTDFVFDGSKEIPYEEIDTPNPLSTYGKSKLLGEKELLKIKDLNFAIFRTSWLYSSFGHNFVKTILKLSKEKKIINVVKDQIGIPTYAKDLALFLLKNIENIPYEKRKIFHYANQGTTTWYDFAREIIHNSNSNCRVKPIMSKDYKTLAVRPKYSVLSTKIVRTMFNTNIREWKMALLDCVNHINGDIT